MRDDNATLEERSHRARAFLENAGLTKVVWPQGSVDGFVDFAAAGGSGLTDQNLAALACAYVASLEPGERANGAEVTERRVAVMTERHEVALGLLSDLVASMDTKVWIWLCELATSNVSESYLNSCVDFASAASIQNELKSIRDFATELCLGRGSYAPSSHCGDDDPDHLDQQVFRNLVAQKNTLFSWVEAAGDYCVELDALVVLSLDPDFGSALTNRIAAAEE